MLKKIASFTLLSALLVTPTFADMDIVIEDFESYADTAALLTAWPSSDPARPNNGTMLIPGDTVGDENGPFYGGTNLTKFAQFCGSANDATGQANCGGFAGGGTVNLKDLPFQINPSETQNIELSVDIGDDAFSANKRLTVGLRSASPAENLIEMGFYNTVGHFSYRAVLFPSGSIPDNGSWSSFNTATIDDPLPVELDTPSEVGRGFHRYKAIITTTGITFSLDLYADGKTNDPLNPVPGEGVDGVDAFDFVPAITGTNGYDQIRFGPPSAIASSGGTNINAAFAAFDNFSLRLVDVGTPVGDGDFDEDGDVDGRDFLEWQRGNSPNGTPGVSVSDVDLAEWQANYNGGLLAAVGAVPEPASAVLLLGMAGFAVTRRR